MSFINDTDIIGCQFGKLIVLECVSRIEKPLSKGRKNGYKYYYKCRCLCESQKEVVVERNHLQTGHTVSCGCIRKIKDLDDIVGLHIGKLHVVNFSRCVEQSYLSRPQNKNYMYNCECECGRLVEVRRNFLMAAMIGNKLSCGCLNPSQLMAQNSPSWKGYGDISGALWQQIKYGAQIRNIPLNITIMDAWRQYVKQDGICPYFKEKLTVIGTFESRSLRWRGYGEISLTVWSNIQREATKRKLVCEITIMDAWQQFLKQKKRCVYTNFILSFNRKSRFKASLDRIDSTKGYTMDNIQWVMKEINIMKLAMAEKEFIENCHKVALSAL